MTTTTKRKDSSPEPTPVNDQPAEPRQMAVALAASYDGPATIDDQLRMANALSEAGVMLPEHYRDKPGNVLAALIMARTLNIGVWSALQRVHIIDGKVGIAGELMYGLLIRAGYRLIVIEESARRVELTLSHPGWSEPCKSVEWTIAEAATAGLTNNPKKPNWQRYPTDMLFWRCMSRLVRRRAPEILMGGAHLPEELEDNYIDGETVPDHTPDTPVPEEVAEIVERVAGYLANPQVEVGWVAGEWKKARKRGLLPLHAGGGVTLETVLHDMGVKAREMEEARTAAKPAPAGMDCGCDPGQVVAEGRHQCSGESDTEHD